MTRSSSRSGRISERSEDPRAGLFRPEIPRSDGASPSRTTSIAVRMLAITPAHDTGSAASHRNGVTSSSPAIGSLNS